MLGLVTHEMHFALLREEVKYGPKKASKMFVIFFRCCLFIFITDFYCLALHPKKSIGIYYNYVYYVIISIWNFVQLK